jgi:hypothetical protein
LKDECPQRKQFPSELGRLWPLLLFNFPKSFIATGTLSLGSVSGVNQSPIRTTGKRFADAFFYEVTHQGVLTPRADDVLLAFNRFGTSRSVYAGSLQKIPSHHRAGWR